MTTIAWDGRTLAADKQSTAGGTPSQTTKVCEAYSPTGERWLYACSGNTAQAQEFSRCVNHKQPIPLLDDLSILAIAPTGEIYQADGKSMFWDRKEIAYWAAGSGADYALGAMAAGKTAKEAVEIAMTLDVSTGLGVDTLDLFQ